MITIHFRPLLALALAATCLFPAITRGQEAFTRTTIDLGCVVSDVDAAAKFYTEAIGFTEVKGFSVDADFSTQAGLTNKQALEIRVFTLGEGKSATKLKIMKAPGSKSKPSDNSTILTELGFSYITIFVSDMTAAQARLQKAGVKIVAEGPAELPAAPGVYLAVVRDPDGNLVELVGPKK